METTEEYRDVFDDLDLIMKEAKMSLDELEGDQDPCAKINKDEYPVDYRLAELEKKWAKDWFKRLTLIKQDLVNYIKTVCARI